MKYNRILIVDDSETSRMIIRKCFEMSGQESAEFIEACDGLDALEKVEKNLPDLVITDLNMPRMDGREFIKRLRLGEKTKGMRIVVTSSLNNDLVASQLRILGVDDIIPKPLSPVKFREALGGIE